MEKCVKNKRSIMCLLFFIFLSGCSKTDLEETTKPSNISGVTMEIKENTLTREGATVIINDINVNGTYVYGIDFRIDRKVDNKWENLNILNDSLFTTKAYSVNDNGKLEFNQNWEKMYGKLENGLYRLVKSVHLSKDTLDSNNKYIFVEFVIE